MNNKKSFVIPVFLLSLVIFGCSTPEGNVVLNPDKGSQVNQGTVNPTFNPANSEASKEKILGQVSTISGGPTGVILNSEFRYKKPLDMVMDNKGNLYVLDRPNIFKIETATGNTKILKFVDKKEPYDLPKNATYDYNNFLAESKPGQPVNLIVPLNENKFTRLILSSSSEEIVNIGEVNFTDRLELGSLTGIAKDSKDNIYVSDNWNGKILKISTDGKISTFAGGGETGVQKGYQDGQGKSALFDSPTGLVFDKSDNLYVCDSKNHRVRKITPDGKVSTMAGSSKGVNNSGNADGKANEAQFNEPKGITIDNSNNIFIADTQNNTIRKITPDGNVFTIAGGGLGYSEGTGNGAKFYQPTAIISDGNKTLYVLDSGNLRIRKIVF